MWTGTARDPGKKLQAVHQGEEHGDGEPLLRRQAAQVIQASQLQSPGERTGGQIMGLIPPNKNHKNYSALSNFFSF